MAPAAGVAAKPAPSLPTPQPKALVTSPSRRSDGSRERWQRQAFKYAEHVLVIKVAGWQGKQLLADVVEEIRGLKTPKRMPIAGLSWYRAKLKPGTRWIVATYRNRGAMPHGGALAILPFTEQHRTRAIAWARPVWRLTPIVLAVRVAKVPVPGVHTAGGRVELDVVKVLRGKVPHRRITDNAWSFAKFRPFKRSRQLYVLSAWSVTSSRYSRLPFFYAHAMTPVNAGQLARIEADVRDYSFAELRKHEAQAQTRLARLQTAWTFQRAPLVADTVVGQSFEEATGCGGHHFTLVPKRWRRGTPATPLATAWGSMVSVRRLVAPYLFYGGGHCYRGSERGGMRYVSAGWVSGRHAAASVQDTPATRRDVRAWVSADRPRFAPLAVDPSIFSAHKPAKPRTDGRDNLLFEPPVGVDVLSLADRRQWARLEVVATRTTQLAGGSVYRWIHVRTVADQRKSAFNYAYKRSQPVHEMMFAGVDLPAWKAGERYWGYWLDAKSKHYRARRGLVGQSAFYNDKLFIADSFVRDRGFYLDQLLRRAWQHTQFKP